MKNFFKSTSLILALFLSILSFRSVFADTVVATIPVGISPQRIVALGTKLYTSDFGAGTVTIIDTANNNTTSTVTVGSGPFVMTTLGSKVYVTNANSGTVSAIDTANNNSVSTIPVGAGPSSIIAFGNKIYVGDCTDNTISIIDTLDNNSVSTLHVGACPSGLATSTTKLYTANFLDDTISVIDTANSNAISSISVGSGSGPYGIVVFNDKIYASSLNLNTVSIIDTANGNAVSTVTVGLSPWSMLFLNNKIYVANYTDNTVSVIDTANDQVIATPATGSGPYTLASVGNKVYVADGNANTVTIIDSANSYATSSLVVGSGPGSFAIVGTRIYSANYYDNNVTAIETASDTTSPDISDISAVPTATTAAVAWTTDEDSSSLIDFGLSSSYSTSTPEIDVVSRVRDHSMNLTGLAACATYHYRITSIDAASNTATSSDRTFTTSGCIGDATISAQISSSVASTTGGTLSLTSGLSEISLDIPSGATDDATYQIKSLSPEAVFGVSGTPDGVHKAGNYAFYFKALTGIGEAVTSFSEPLQITMHYQDSDVSGIDESSLVLYRYDGSSWHVLTGCTVNASSNTITCATSNFSFFSLFGTATAVAVTSNTTSNSINNGMPFGWNNYPLAPSEGFLVTINDGSSTTPNRVVSVRLNAGPDVKKMAVSLTGDFSDAITENYTPTVLVDLCSKFGGSTKNPTCPDGQYTVYVKVYNQYGSGSNVFSQKINLKIQKIQNLPSAIFTTPLKFKMQSKDVSRLQQLLATIPGIYPEKLVTGYFGLLTKKAVEAFQLKYNVVTSKSDVGFGLVGPKTRATLKEVFDSGVYVHQ